MRSAGRILVVDDCAEHHQTIRDILSNDYDIAFADRADTARGVAARRRPDLVLLDVGGADGYWVHGNAKHLRTVCDVLLDNAIRFSPRSGTVAVHVSSLQGRATLRVADHGKGIDATLRERIFDSFTVDDLLHHQGGHGISLALSRAIVEYHGGEIHAASRPQVRTTFEMQLPQATPKPNPISAPPTSAVRHLVREHEGDE